MSVEVTCLYGAILLGLAQLMIATHLVTRQRGFKWNLSSREDQAPPLIGAAGRLDRAAKNFAETFPYFAAATLLLQMLGRNSNLSEIGAATYLIGRVVYVPIYALGIQGVRSVVWLVSMLGIGLILYSIIF